LSLQGYKIADNISCGFTATGSVNGPATLDASLGALRSAATKASALSR
jgi:hypothetical protein